MLRTSILPVLAFGALATAAQGRTEPPLVEKYLHQGQLTEGEKALAAELQRNKDNDQARFGLGALQFLRAVEHLGQSLHRYGLRSDQGQQFGIPFLRLPVPVNPNPESLNYAASRKIVQDLIDDLTKAEATLAIARDEKVKLPLRVGLIRLDLAGSGKASDPFKTILARYMGGERNLPKADDWLVVFDRGDVAWLRGYCHLLSALAEIALAHDSRELFEHTAHLFFARVDTPFAFLTASASGGADRQFDFTNIVDFISFIHLLRLPVHEPERMKRALGHLERMLALSRESWKFILAESDDDHEWLPNPKQQGVLGVPIRREMIDGWLEFVTETEALLAGKRLAPFWRGDGKRGVNLRRVFTEPRTFDLVLWLQGTAATHYLEEGTMTKPEIWGRLQRVFGGEFVGFVIWFN